MFHTLDVHDVNWLSGHTNQFCLYSNWNADLSQQSWINVECNRGTCTHMLLAQG